MASGAATDTVSFALDLPPRRRGDKLLKPSCQITHIKAGAALPLGPGALAPPTAAAAVHPESRACWAGRLAWPSCSDRRGRGRRGLYLKLGGLCGGDGGRPPPLLLGRGRSLLRRLAPRYHEREGQDGTRGRAPRSREHWTLDSGGDGGRDPCDGCACSDVTCKHAAARRHGARQCRKHGDACGAMGHGGHGHLCKRRTRPRACSRGKLRALRAHALLRGCRTSSGTWQQQLSTARTSYGCWRWLLTAYRRALPWRERRLVVLADARRVVWVPVALFRRAKVGKVLYPRRCAQDRLQRLLAVLALRRQARSNHEVRWRLFVLY